MADSLDPKTAGPTIKVEIEFAGNSGRADVIVPLRAARRGSGSK